MRSIDFSVHELYIADAVSLDSSRLLCLAGDTEEGYADRVIGRFNVIPESFYINTEFIVFNFETGTIEK